MERLQGRNEVRIYRCDSWEDFMRSVRSCSLGGDRLFRGHGDSRWALSSGWERWIQMLEAKRNIDPDAALRMCSLYLTRFRNRIVGLKGLRRDSFKTDHEWWALGRHHGLLTPLLDWTRSPYIAAHFAFEGFMTRLHPNFGTFPQLPPYFGEGTEHEKEYITVWELDGDGSLDDGEEHSLTEGGVFEVFTTKSDDAYRQIAQQGYFSWLHHREFRDLESYLESRQKEMYLARYDIPAREVKKALVDLQLMNITHASLFPDLDGITRVCNLMDMFHSGAYTEPET